MDDDLNWQYSLEDLDTFKDLTHLVNLAVDKINRFVEHSTTYFFVLQQEFHEYKEVNREGTFAIPEESQLITYLALRNTIISHTDISEEDFFKQAEEEVLQFLFSKEMQINVIVPIVYRFRLLGFMAISLRHKQRKKKKLADQEHRFLELLKESLRVNMYAAILIDKRFFELLSLVDLTKKLEGIETYQEIMRFIPEMARNIVNYDCAVYYEFDEDENRLIPQSHHKVDHPMVLTPGNSISGYVFSKKKPAIINNIKDHVFFNEINEEKYFTHAFISIPFLTLKKRFGVLTIGKNSPNEEFSVDQLYLLRIIAAFISDFMENKQLYFQLEKSYFDTVSSLATALEAKDKYTRGHSERVMELSVGIAKQLNLEKATIRDIKYAAILHDIGKIGITEYIITKPGKLTSDEYQVIQSHPMIGAEILSSIAFLDVAKEYVRYHHEKLNGQGYYKKQKGEFPWETTIISLADSYDALTSDRPYRKAIHPELAIQELKRSVNTQFDGRVFEALVRYLKEKKIIRDTLVL